MVFRIPNAATHSLLDLLNLARCKCFGAHERGSLTRLSWGQRERYAVENQEPAGITGQVYTVVLNSSSRVIGAEEHRPAAGYFPDDIGPSSPIAERCM